MQVIGDKGSDIGYSTYILGLPANRINVQGKFEILSTWQG